MLPLTDAVELLSKIFVDVGCLLVYSRPVVNKPMTESATRDLFPGALEMMILESLRRQPAHGYALVQHIQMRSKNLLQVEEGSLYPALQRLLKSKLVKAEWGGDVFFFVRQHLHSRLMRALVGIDGRFAHKIVLGAGFWLFQDFRPFVGLRNDLFQHLAQIRVLLVVLVHVVLKIVGEADRKSVV